MHQHGHHTIQTHGGGVVVESSSVVVDTLTVTDVVLSLGCGLAPGPPTSVVLGDVVVPSLGPLVVVVVVVVYSVVVGPSFVTVGTDMVDPVGVVVVVVSAGSFGAVGTDGVVTPSGRVVVMVVGVVTSGGKVTGGG